MDNLKKQSTYIAIDLKSFYASVECVERGLDPLTTNLVVADTSRTEKTICLAVSPSLKAYGIPGRARLFEVVQKVAEVNRERRAKAKDNTFAGSSFRATELQDSSLELSYIAATPRMGLYIKYSADIYDIYLNYVAPEDIHVYSIDEVFMDVTHYLAIYKMSPKELASKIVQEILEKTGITATAGIGTNLYLCKVAMDIVAKHVEPDKNGVRIAYLDEYEYRRLLWNHRPLTDFWRIGHGYEKKLQENGMFTMGDVARCSIGKETDFYNEDLLYKLFGINAELLIDHAWGYEPCTIDIIKNYKPDNNSISSGQVLQHPYTFEKGRLIVKEMTDLLVLDLVEKGMMTNQMVLTIGYDIDNLNDDAVMKKYSGEITQDYYGRKVPKHAHGSTNLPGYTSSTKIIIEHVMELYDKIVDPRLHVRRIGIGANHVLSEAKALEEKQYEQLSLFDNYEKKTEERKEEESKLNKEKKLQQAMLDVKKKFGKNAMLKGMNLEEGAMTIERNNQIGGHKA